jgi:hypothetical protein
MNCNAISPLLADYWAGTLDAAGREAVELHLAGCVECRQSTVLWARLGLVADEAPGPALRTRFDAMLTAYREGLEQRATPRRFHFADLWPRQRAWQVAVAVVCLIGGALGGHQFAANRAQSGEIAHLRTELATTREMMALALLQQQSASDRLRGVSWSTALPAPEPEVLTALLTALKDDPSVDVRLAAADALRQYGQLPQVRQGLLEALNSRQQSPLVQVALIDTLADLRERRSVNLLKHMQADREVDATVRDRAQWAVQQF